MHELEEMGPVDYLVVEFPGGRMTGEGFPLLVELVDRGIIRILDLVFVRKDRDGSVTRVAIVDLDESLDLSVFDGASSGLVADDDVEEAATVLKPGSIGVILVFENRWAAPLAIALRRGGAELIATERIPVQALLASLDAADAGVPRAAVR